jgi:hypothetical protein
MHFFQFQKLALVVASFLAIPSAFAVRGVADGGVDLSKVSSRIKELQKSCESLGKEANGARTYLYNAVAEDQERRLASSGQAAYQALNKAWTMCNEQASKIDKSQEKSLVLNEQIRQAETQMRAGADSLVANTESSQRYVSEQTAKLNGLLQQLSNSLEETATLVGTDKENKKGAIGKVREAFFDLEKKKNAWAHVQLSQGNRAIGDQQNASGKLDNFRLMLQDRTYNTLAMLLAALQVTQGQVAQAKSSLAATSATTALNAKNSGKLSTSGISSASHTQPGAAGTARSATLTRGPNTDNYKLSTEDVVKINQDAGILPKPSQLPSIPTSSNGETDYQKYGGSVGSVLETLQVKRGSKCYNMASGMEEACTGL